MLGNKSGWFDSSFETADGPLAQDIEKAIPIELVPASPYQSLTDTQKETVTKFRDVVKDWILTEQEDHYLHTDFYLSRFLQARNWEIQKAKEMFVAAMTWRKQKDIQNIFQRVEEGEYFDILSNYWPVSLCREWDFWSYDNCFVSYQRSGTVDISIMDLVPIEELIDYHCYVMEVLERKYAKVYKMKGYVPGQIIFEDMTGFGSAFTSSKIIEMVKQVAQIDSDYYPAILRKFYFFNAPPVFTMLWSVVKKFIDKDTLAKFEFLGSSKEKNEALFKKLVPEKYLLQDLGGSSAYKMPPGGSVNQLLQTLPMRSPTLRRIKIDRNSSFVHTIQVEKPMQLAWEFNSSEDTKLSLTLSGSKKVLYKVDSKAKEDKGAHMVEPGLYNLAFQNNSFWNDSVLKYRYDLIQVD